MPCAPNPKAWKTFLATRPGLPLVAESDGHTDPDRAFLRQVQAEHAAWRRGWAVDSPAGQRSRQPWDEQPGSRQGQATGPARAAQGPQHEDAKKEGRQTYWVVNPEPTACDKCLTLAGPGHAGKPERPQPNCKRRANAVN